MPISKVENGRAAFAFDVVSDTLKKHVKNDSKKEDYRSYIKKMPMMININGLAQTLAFYFSKKNGDMHFEIYKQLEIWIKEYYSKQLDLGRENLEKDFIEMIVNLERDEYRMVTLEILNILGWMDRFVVGLIGADYSTNNGSDVQ